MTPDDYRESANRYREEAQPAVNALIEQQISEKALPNALAMVGVTLGALLLNLMILYLVTGG